jgi:hypothetical protein
VEEIVTAQAKVAGQYVRYHGLVMEIVKGLEAATGAGLSTICEGTEGQG